MRAHGIQGAKRRGKPWRTTTPDPAAARPADLVDRDFSAADINELWVGDFSYLRCWEGVVYFAFVLDVCSRRIVGWQLATHMRTSLVLDALQMALHTRGPGADFALIAHTDRGSQYTSDDYTQELSDHEVLASVGSAGDAYDNAMAESFVDTFKTERAPRGAKFTVRDERTRPWSPRRPGEAGGSLISEVRDSGGSSPDDVAPVRRQRAGRASEGREVQRERTSG